MTQEPKPSTFWKDPQVAAYLVVCGIALVVITMVLLARDSGPWSFAPLVVGVLGGLTGLGPVILLIALGICLNIHPPLSFSTRAILDPRELVICAAALAYVSGHYRLQSLLVGIFPTRPRRRPRAGRPGSLQPQPKAPSAARTRSPRLVTRQEVALLIMSVLPWAILGQLYWRGMARYVVSLGPLSKVWLAILVSWLIALAAYATASILGYLDWSRLTPAESKLYLQDVLWQETRHEQRRINRWLAWGRIRRDRKETS